MDDKLKKRLVKIDEQIELLYQAEEKYLTLEAVKEHIRAVMTSKALGASQAAKECQALATDDYRAFKESLAKAEAEFHKQRHILELKIKAYDAEHLSLKVEVPVINRQQ